MRFSSNLSGIYTKWGVQAFPPIFGLFAIFDRNFAKIVAPPSDESKNYLAILKGQSLLKMVKKNKIRPINRDTLLLFKLCPPRMKSAAASDHDRKNTIFSNIQSACVVRFPKLCMIIELVEATKKLLSFFFIQRSFFPLEGRQNVDFCAPAGKKNIQTPHFRTDSQRA